MGESGGLIPAHAGKTGLRNTSRAMYRAHPRSRGENVTVSEGWEKLEGSSPLTRGKPEPGPVSASATGLIPAHAGKTTRKAQRRRSDRAHPRSRGENIVVSWPYFRGTWLIPAHAGKTLPDLRFYRADRSDLGKP